MCRAKAWLKIKSVAKARINLTVPRLHPGLRNSLEHQLILTTPAYLGYLAAMSSNLSCGLWSSELAWGVLWHS